MITKDEKQRLRDIISETITLLCKSRLFQKFKDEFYIEGLIGITLDRQELMLVSIHEKICNDVKQDAASPVEKDVSIVEDTGNHSGKKRKTPHENGPKEKTPKVERQYDISLKHQMSPLTGSKFNSDSYNPRKQLPSPAELPSSYLPTSNSPSHLERLKNFYMLSAGYANAFNMNAGSMATNLGAGVNNMPSGALNLAIDSNKASPTTKTNSWTKTKVANHQESNTSIIKIKEEYKPVIKTEEDCQPHPLMVQPIPLTTYPMYTPPPRKQQKQQPVFSEPLMVPQLVKSPSLMQSAIHSPQRDSKLSDILDKIRNNVDGREDGRRSVFDHIAHNIVRTEGKFITSRMIGRKTGRKAVAIREVFLKLTTPVHDLNHIGQAKEISRGSLVYYKCPPSLIKEEALTKYGLDLEMYKLLYISEMKTPPSQHMMSVVEGHYPYDVGMSSTEDQSKLIGTKVRSPPSMRKQEYFSNFESLGNADDDGEEVPGLNSDVLLSHKQDDKEVIREGEEAMASGRKDVDFIDGYSEANGLRDEMGLAEEREEMTSGRKDVDFSNGYSEANGLRDEIGLVEDHQFSSSTRFESSHHLQDSPPECERLLMDVGLPVEEDGEIDEVEDDEIDEVAEDDETDEEFDELVQPDDNLSDNDEVGVYTEDGSEGSLNGQLESPCHVQRTHYREFNETVTPLAGLEKLVSERNALR